MKQNEKNGNGDFSLAITETNNYMFLSRAKYDLAIASLLALILLPIGIMFIIWTYELIGVLLILVAMGAVIVRFIWLLLAKYYKK
jgi:NADH:ubiquinone oxidoreductase subunit 6 (subunit J)